MEVNTDQLLKLLYSHFGYSSFRDGQLEIIQSAMSNPSTLVLMPTGGGKSMCFQIPALAFPGTTLVISPLIALMKDQVDALRQNGINAAYFNSSQSNEEQQGVIQDLQAGKIKLLYLAPEKLMANNAEFLQFLANFPIPFIAIDEAHCISQWGHDFRPEYLQLKSLNTYFPRANKIALTATADERTRLSIIENLGWEKPTVFVSSFNRANIEYVVQAKSQSKHKLLDFLEDKKGESGIIYVLSRKSTESVAEFLRDHDYEARAYHAGLSKEQREENQDAFLQDDCKIMVATIAFGMGIDKSNVRFVVHMDLPKNMEGYYQETGRAGRDGLPSKALLFFSRGDAITLQGFISSENPEHQQLMTQKLRTMVSYGESTKCRRKFILNYFDEEFEAPCGSCDQCLKVHDQFDGTIIAQKALSAVYRLEQRFGINFVIDFLRGSKSAKIKDFHRSIKTYGVGSDISKAHWRSYIQHLIDQDFLKLIEGEYPLLGLGSKSKPVLKGELGVALNRPEEEIKPRSFDLAKPDHHAGLFEKLKDWRHRTAKAQGVPPYIILSDATLLELASFFPVNIESLSFISGFGEVKLDKYGSAITQTIAAFCKAENITPKTVPQRRKKTVKKKKGKAAKGSSRLSVEMFQAGKSLERICEERGLAKTTIEGHLALGVEDGTLTISDLIPEVKIEAVKNAIKSTSEAGLKPLKEKLGDDYSYGEIRLVLAEMKKVPAS